MIASADQIGGLLGWQPKYNDLDEIISTTLAWERYRQDLMSVVGVG